MGKDTLKNSISSAQQFKGKKSATTEAEAKTAGLTLMDTCKICFLGTSGEDGFPNIKAMLNLRHEGLKTVWLSTNTSSKRVAQLNKDNRSCIYYVDDVNFKALMLVGTVEVLQDMESRKLLWMEGAEVYYPGGIDDPDYTVLRFTVRRGNYYYGLGNVSFEIY